MSSPELAKSLIDEQKVMVDTIGFEHNFYELKLSKISSNSQNALAKSVFELHYRPSSDSLDVFVEKRGTRTIMAWRV
jgi:hypothetical protein